MGLAAAAGAGYGVIARFIAPNAGIYPTHYAVWFVVAYKIKEILNHCEERAYILLGNEEFRLSVPFTELSSAEKLSLIVWKSIYYKN
jgi:hypothetical protein